MFEHILRFHAGKLLAQGSLACRCAKLLQNGRLKAACERRGFSALSTTPHPEIDRLKALLSHTSHEPSYVYSETVREHIANIRKNLEPSEDTQASDIVQRLAEDADRYHDVLVKYMQNRDRYNQVSLDKPAGGTPAVVTPAARCGKHSNATQAVQTKITNDANIKYGVVGVAFMCVFGSLGFSLHPGCALGGYIYRPVFRQSRLKEETMKTAEQLIRSNRECKQQMRQLHHEIGELVGQLEAHLAKTLEK
ncbi:hypothetical protein BBBOND_0102360 [Babesia bigemina]|uniref:Uncharacterized protein n=1 Tax=Babesia bigemina TaxID=5866 RepID=A0A061D1C0_BABBI|nr:hypothetical protein BBBOND_0102360 [Babesia bigemina]CDR93907.1 hypothetical protein BBBOND_0102360 [Babesia bigemina]|eukprot:XP_012766093.1 hypothetical protein BBBOND_0102360 [Babesia bigemina]